jgi:hypothetical protein
MSKKALNKPWLRAQFPEGFVNEIPPVNVTIDDSPIAWNAFTHDVPLPNGGNFPPSHPGEPPCGPARTTKMTDFLGAMLRLGMITPVVHGEIVAMFKRTKAGNPDSPLSGPGLVAQASWDTIIPADMPRGQDNVGLLAATMHAALVATRQTYGEAALETLRKALWHWAPLDLRPLVWRKMGVDLMRHVLFNIETRLTQAYTVEAVMVFDKGEFVPIVKEVERSKRQNSTRKITPMTWDGKRTIIGLQKWLPFWPGLNKNHATRWAAMQQFTEMMQDHYWPPLGKRIIIDGGIRGALPLRIEHDPVTGRAVSDAPEYANTIGEADMAVYFHAHNFSLRMPGGAIEIMSKDTDIALLSLFHSAQRRVSEDDKTFTNQLFVRVGWIKPVRPTDKPKPEFVDANAMVLAIERAMPKLKWPVESLVTCCMMVGNDYVTPYLSLTPERILNAYFHNYERIGDLITFNPIPGNSVASTGLDPKAYKGVLKYAYQSLQEGRLGKAEDGHRASWAAVVDAVKAGNAKRVTWHVPPDHIILARMMRLLWNLHYAVTGPFNEPIPSGLDGYGWCLKNPALGCVPGNIGLDDTITLPE